MKGFHEQTQQHGVFPLFHHLDYTKCHAFWCTFRSSGLALVPPELSQMALHNSYLSLKQHRCQSVAHSLDLAHYSLPGWKRATFGGRFIVLEPAVL